MNLTLGAIPLLRRKVSIQKLPYLIEKQSCSLWIEPSSTKKATLFRGKRKHALLDTGQLLIYQYPICNGKIPQKSYRLILHSLAYYQELSIDHSVYTIEHISKEDEKSQAKDMVFLEENRIFHMEGTILMEHLNQDNPKGIVLQKKTGKTHERAHKPPLFL